MLKKLFFDYDEYILEQFQLENLLSSGVPFKLFNLDKPVMSNKALYSQVLMKGVSSSDPINDLLELNADKEFPVILLCKDGKKSKTFVKKIVKQEFKNVYFVKGGFDSLK